MNEPLTAEGAVSGPGPQGQLPARLALGTVQLGFPYGVDRPAQAVSQAEARAIVLRARQLGFVTLDTAVSYGESEARLGEIGVGQWQVITKLPPVPDECIDVRAWMRNSTRESLRRLQSAAVYGILLHDPRQLVGARGEEIYCALQALREQALVSRIGVSVYDPAELDELVPRFRFDIVQAPFNVFDRRLHVSGWLSKLHTAGTEIHARSIFLQGLLLMHPSKRPAYFRPWQQLFAAWDAWLVASGRTALQACLGFALAHPGLDRLVLGVNSVAHLNEITANAAPMASLPPDCIASIDPDLINPSRWRLQ